MKIRNWFSVFVGFLFLQGCNSESSEQDVNDVKPDIIEQKVKITVLEKGTRTPISGAVVELLRCSKYDFEFGCVGYSGFYYLATNAQGEIEYKRTNDAVAMKASHSDYWDRTVKGDYGEILLNPNAWVKIQLEQTGNYEAGSNIRLEIKREFFDLSGYIDFNNYFELPADTTLYIRVRALEKTVVSWEVISPTNTVMKSNLSEVFVVNKADTVSRKIQF